MKRIEIRRSASSIPGRDIVQLLTQIAPGVAHNALDVDPAKPLATFTVAPLETS